jgi:hemerythrin superfamily protein
MLKEIVETVLPDDGVIGMLKQDHRKVEQLFEQFETSRKENDRRTMLHAMEQALRELEVHAAIEEEMVYPAIRCKIDDEQVMDEAVEEHHVAHVLIGELRRMRSGDDRYAAKFKVLAESVKHHVKEEESQVFPKAREAKFETSDMKDRVMRRKQQLLQGSSASRAATASRSRSRGRKGTRRAVRRSRSARTTRRARAA